MGLPKGRTEDLEEALDALYDKAMKGDPNAFNLHLDKALPTQPPQSLLIQEVKRKLKQGETAAATIDYVFEALTIGGVSPSELEPIIKLIDARIKQKELPALEKRISKLEKKTTIERSSK